GGTASGAFADKNVGTGKTVTVSGSTLGGADAGNYTLIQQYGLTADITAASLSITNLSVADKTYDGTVAASISGTPALSGILSSDSVSLNVSNLSAAFADKNVGTGKPITVSGLSLSGPDARNYSASASSTTASINKAALTMTAVDNAKVINDADPTLSARYSGFVSGENASELSSVSVIRAAGEAAGSYTITPSASASNYTVTPVTGSFTVQPADRLLVQVSDASTTYGTAPSFAITSARYYSSTGAALRTLIVSNTGGNTWRADDGLGTTFTFDLAATGTSAGNFAIGLSGTPTQVNSNFSSVAFANGNLAIAQRPISLSASSGVTKVYDGTANASGASVTIGNKVVGDDVSVSGVGVFADKDAGNAKNFSVYNLQLSGTAAANYYITPSDISAGLTGNTGVITARTVSLSASKTYDGSTSLANAVTIDTGISAEALAYTGASSSDAHVATAGKYISAITLVNGVGGLAANYQLPSLDSSHAPVTINARSLTASAAITGVAKTYDGLLAATGSSVSGSTSGAVGSDSIALDTSAVSLAYSDAHVATANKTIAATGSVALGTISNSGSGDLSGSSTSNRVISAASDYVLAAQPSISSVAGTINTKTLTATAPTITAAAKTYDGTVAATGSSLSGGSVTGVVGADSASLNSVSLAFDSAHAGSRNVTATSSPTLNFSGTAKGTGTGASAGNEVAGNTSDYSFTAPTISSVAATINAAQLTVTASNASKTYDGAAYSGGNGVAYSGFVNSESSSVLGGTLGYAGTSQGARNAGSYVITPNGLTSANYTVSFVDGTLTINQAGLSAIVASLSGTSSKVYDGNTTATLAPGNFSLSGFATGEGASVTKTSGTYDTANAGTGKTVTVNLASSDYSANSGTTLTNYTLPSSVSGTIGTITKAHLTVTADNQSRLYGASNPTFTQAISGFVNSENASSAGVTGTATGSTAATA
ncbi:MAG: YDG domain-containing protein, partial [Comamonadaceae bacterium]